MEIEELKRLLYVACTRARDHLIISGLHNPAPQVLSSAVWLKYLLEYFGSPDDRPPVSAEFKPYLTIPEPPLPAPARLIDTIDAITRPEAEAPAPEPPAFYDRARGKRPETHPLGVFTATDLNLYRHCPRRYFLEKILKLTPEPTGRQTEEDYAVEENEEIAGRADLGTALHWALERVSFEAGEAEISTLVHSALRFFGLDLPAGERNGLIEALSRTLRLPLFERLDRENVRREHSFTLSLADEKGRYVIKGAIDLWINGPHENFVVDYKYAEPKPGQEDYYDLQLLIYGLAVSAGTGRAAKAALLYLKPNPPQLVERLAVGAQEREREVIRVCTALMERERATLRTGESLAVDLWEKNPSFCSMAHCGYADACDLPERGLS